MPDAMYLVFDTGGRRLRAGRRVAGEKAFVEEEGSEVVFVLGGPAGSPTFGRASRPERDPSRLMMEVVSLCSRLRFRAYFESSIISAGAGRARGEPWPQNITPVGNIPNTPDVAATFYTYSRGEPVRLI